MRLRRSGREPSSVWRYSLPLAVCFFLGILAGTVYAARTGGSAGEELKNYLSAYLTAAQGREISVSVLCTLALAYLWGPVLSFYCGFFAAGGGFAAAADSSLRLSSCLRGELSDGRLRRTGRLAGGRLFRPAVPADGSLLFSSGAAVFPVRRRAAGGVPW